MLGTDLSSNLVSERLSSFKETELNTNIDQDKAKKILAKLLGKTKLTFNSNIFEINETIANEIILSRLQHKRLQDIFD